MNLLLQKYFPSATAMVSVIGFLNVFHTFDIKIKSLIASNEKMAKKNIEILQNLNEVLAKTSKEVLSLKHQIFELTEKKILHNSLQEIFSENIDWSQCALIGLKYATILTIGYFTLNAASSFYSKAANPDVVAKSFCEQITTHYDFISKSLWDFCVNWKHTINGDDKITWLAGLDSSGNFLKLSQKTNSYTTEAIVELSFGQAETILDVGYLIAGNQYADILLEKAKADTALVRSLEETLEAKLCLITDLETQLAQHLSANPALVDVVNDALLLID
jgi:hypothetical protein